MRAFLDPADPAILHDLKRIACAAVGMFALVEWPVLQLAWQPVSRDTPAFDEAMGKALAGHRHYNAKVEPARGTLAMLALAPLALAVLAKDVGVTTTVESDYIPRWIIDR